ALPFDLIMRAQDHVDDVAAVVAMAQLDEALGPEQLGRREDAHLVAVHFYVAGVFEPAVRDRHGPVGPCEYHIEEVASVPDLAEPPVVLHLDFVAPVLEMGENAGVIACLPENVEILRLPAYPGIGA